MEYIQFALQDIQDCMTSKTAGSEHITMQLNGQREFRLTHLLLLLFLLVLCNEKGEKNYCPLNKIFKL